MRGTLALAVVVAFTIGMMAGAVTEQRLTGLHETETIVAPVAETETIVPPVDRPDNCGEVADAAIDVIETFGEFVGVVLDGNAVLAQIGQRAAARGLVRQSETDKIAASANELETMNGRLARLLGDFERKAAQCYAQR